MADARYRRNRPKTSAVLIGLRLMFPRVLKKFVRSLFRTVREKRQAFRKGVWPRWIAYRTLRHVQTEDTFKGLVLRGLANERSRLLVTFVDKVAARSYVASLSSQVTLPTVYQVVEDARDLDPSLWPEEFVIKPSHGSGALVIVSKEGREGLSYQIPNGEFRWDNGIWGMLTQDFDPRVLENLGRQWLKSGYEYWSPKYPEWAYRHVPRKIIVEELLVGTQAHPLVEARFHCFHGFVRLARVTNVLSTERRAWTLDPEGRVLDAWLETDPIKEVSSFAVPPMWSTAIREAGRLSRDIDYLRVDLYLTDTTVYFSELTPFPNGGNVDFLPEELSTWLAALWKADADHLAFDNFLSTLKRSL